MTAPRADGPDIYHGQTITGQPVDPAWSLCVHKCSEGSHSGDPTFPQRFAWMHAQGFKYRGAYHWLRSDSTVKENATNFLIRARAAGWGARGDFAECDWEVTPNIPLPTSLDAAEFADRINQNVGRETNITYTGTWLPDSPLDTDTRREFLEWRDENPDAPLWLAFYNTADGGGWAECAKYAADVWQWTSNFRHASIVTPQVGGGFRGFDMNHVFDWAMLDRLTDQLPPPPPPPVDPNREEDVTAKLIINDPILNASFTHDGVPIAPEDIPAMVEQGWKQVARDHKWWRAAIMHRNGPEATRLYYGDR